MRHCAVLARGQHADDTQSLWKLRMQSAAEAAAVGARGSNRGGADGDGVAALAGENRMRNPSVKKGRVPEDRQVQTDKRGGAVRRSAQACRVQLGTALQVGAGTVTALALDSCRAPIRIRAISALS